MPIKFSSRILVGLACLFLSSFAEAASPFGNALSFNGANQYVSVANFGNIAPTNEVTVEFWAYDTNSAVQQSAFMLQPDDPANRFQAHINYFNGYTYWDFGNINGIGRIFAPNPPNSISNWVHYALVASQSGNYMNIYVNGQLYATQPGMTPFVRGNYELRLGGNTNYMLNGRLDEFRIWNTALTQAQIQSNLVVTLTGSEPNLLLYYRFDSSAGNGAINSATATGSAYNGILMNGGAWTPSTVLIPGPVTTLPATGVANPNATLNGSVQSFGQPMNGYFQWGVTTNYGNATAPMALTLTNGTQTFSSTLTGLASAVYHYRAVVKSGAGVFTGQDLQFWPTTLTLNGTNPFTNECHSAYVDPGTQVSALPSTVADGNNHYLALRVDGTVAAWGDNSFGQLNVPGNLTNAIAIAINNFNSLALRSDGTVAAWGRDRNGQTSGASVVANATAIANGVYHGVALKSDKTVVAWGDTTYLQTTVPSNATNVTAIAAGDYHSLALKGDGTVVAWGAGKVNNPPSLIDYGQSIVPANATGVVAIAACTYHSLALRSDGTVVSWGSATTPPANLTNVIAIAAGGTHDLALRSDGSVVAWGDNSAGQLNVPVSVTNILAVTAGGNQSFALRADGVWIGWGGQSSLPSVATNLNPIIHFSGNLDTNTPGTYPITYAYTNSFGTTATNSRNVVVADRTASVLTLVGTNLSFLALNAAYVEPGYSALDACQGDLTASVIVTGTVNSSVPGTNILTYTVTDAAANTSIKQRTLLVVSVPTINSVSAQVTATNSITGTRTVAVSANVNPNGLAGNCLFQYGLNTNYAGITAQTAFASSYFATNLTVSISNLLAGVTYHFRAVATNTSGSTTSPDYAFLVPASYQTGDLNGDGVVDQGEYNIVLSNYLSAIKQLTISNPAGLGKSKITFDLGNLLSGSFSVQSSTDLVNWKYLGPAKPLYYFIDTNSPLPPKEFYRLRYP